MPPKNKKAQKRQKPKEVKKDDNKMDSNLAFMSEQFNMKKKKIIDDACRESRQKLLNVMNRQLETEKQNNNELLKNFSQMLAEMEDDYVYHYEDNAELFQSLTELIMTCFQQTTNAWKQMIKGLNEITSSYKKQCEAMDEKHKAKTDKLVDKLQEDFKKLEHKLISETKRSQWEKLSVAILHEMENDE